MFKWLRRCFTLLVIVSLLALNVLTLVHGAVFGVLSGALERVSPHIKTNAGRMNQERAANRATAQRQRTDTGSSPRFL
jgi:hypothetical protein